MGFGMIPLSPDDKPDGFVLLSRYEKLESENAKLRELVKRMHRHIRQTCGECDGWYCSNFDEDNECCVYDTLARELGVEP